MELTAALFAAYLVLMVAIGLWAAARGEDSDEDYFLGGRRFSGLVTALSAVSTGRSAWLVIGASGAAWAVGLSALWLFPGYVLAELWLFLWLGPRLRAASVAAGAVTVPEVLAGAAAGPDGRPGTSRLPLRQAGGAAIVAFTVGYVAAQLLAGGKALEAVLGLPGDSWGLALTAGIVGLYTLLGGYRAVALTDVVQALLMLVGLVVLPALGIAAVGGPGALVERLRAVDPALLDPFAEGWLYALGGLAIGLGSPGQPGILARHMALRDPREARLAAAVGTAWNALAALGALALGLVGRALHPTAATLPGGDREQLFAALSLSLSEQYLFAGFAGVLLAALFAAVMSTCDSQLLVVGSAFTRDLRPRAARGRGSAWLGRAGVLAALVGALLLNQVEALSELVFATVLLAWGALGVAFGPALVVLLARPGTRAGGVLGALLVGALGALAWWALLRPPTLTWQLGPLFALALGVAWWGGRPRR